MGKVHRGSRSVGKKNEDNSDKEEQERRQKGGRSASEEVGETGNTRKMVMLRSAGMGK